MKTPLRGSYCLFAWPLLLALGLVAVPQLPAASCASAPPGLVGWWPGEGNVQDVVGGHHGFLRGGATATEPGFIGKGFSFDGTNRYVEIPDSPALKPAQLTVECWVRFDNLNAPGTSFYPGQQYLVFKQNSRYGNFEGYVLSKDRTHDDIILWEVTSSSGKLIRIDSVSVVTTNVWYHLAGVRGADYIEIYFNGVLEARADVDFPQDYGTQPLYFGTSGQDWYDRKLNGMLDEVALYNRALSAQEIRALYLAGRAGKCGRPISGTYRGLFTGANSLTEPGSGSITLSVTPRGTFSGQLAFEDGSTRSVKGSFDTNGVCTLAVKKGTNAVPLTLYLERGRLEQVGEIVGFLSDATSTASLTASRCDFNTTANPFPRAGRYTLALSGTPDSETEPGGSTHATVLVGKNGSITLKGYLGDGTSFSQKTVVTRDGHWPFYTRLYSGRGSILGWVSLESDSGTDLVGRLHWTRPANARAQYYPAGFVVEREIEASIFTAPAKIEPIIDMPAGILELEGGNLADSIENGVQFGPGAGILDLGPNRLKASFSRSTGAFSGKITDSATLQTRKFSGVLLQKQNRGAGFFRGSNLTGNVSIEAQP